MPADDPWFVYLVECGDGTYYCGVAKDVSARLILHNEGRGAKYTRARLPVTLIATSRALEKVDAYKLEYRVKSVTRNRKRETLLAP